MTSSEPERTEREDRVHPFIPTGRVGVGVTAALASGIAVRTYHLVAPQSLWADEAKLALNIIRRNVAELILTPLAHGQVAPPGFLFFQKILIEALGPSEAALRLFPFLCGVGALVLMVLAFRELRADPQVTMIGLALLAVSPYLILYSANVKQYATDVAAALLVLVLTIRFHNVPTLRRSIALGLFGGLLAWLSHGVFFVYLGTASVLVTLWVGKRSTAPQVGVAAGTLGMVALPAATLTLWANHSARGFMQEYWTDGFLPFPPANVGEILAYPEGILRLFAHPGGFQAGAVLGGLAFAVGVAVHMRRDSLLPLLLLSPLLGLLIAAAASVYPIGGEPSAVSGRLLLWTIPLLVIGIAYGVGFFLRHPSVVVRSGGVVLIAILMVDSAIRVPSYLRTYRQYDSRSMAEIIASDANDQDPIHTYGLVWSPMEYYQILLGFDNRILITNEFAPPTSSQRTWLVYYSFEPPPPEYSPERLGTSIGRISAPGIGAHLIQGHQVRDD